MNRNNEKGAALVLTMILLATLAVMTVSMMFLSQTEGWSTANYRMMSQARDGAEAAVHRAANFLVGGSSGAGAVQPGGFQYVPPSALTPFQNLGATSPVLLAAGGNRVGLSTSNITPPFTLEYPTGAGVTANVQTNFDSTNGAKGTLTLGTSETGITQVEYGAYAELIATKAIASALLCGGAGAGSLETWKITGQGRITGVQGATVQVSSIIDRPIVSCPTFAAYATDNSCDTTQAPLWFNGGGVTSSYDSTTPGCNNTTIGTVGTGYGDVGTGSCGLMNVSGSVGTNGSTNFGNSAQINGSLYQPDNGAGGCNTVAQGDNEIEGDPQFIEQAQPIDFPDPLAPTPAPPPSTTHTIAGATGGNRCSLTPGCFQTASNGITALPPNNFRILQTCSPAVVQCGSGAATYGNLTLTGSGNTYHLCAGTYNVNRIAIGNPSAVIQIHTTADSICSTSGPVYINVAGANSADNINVIDFGSGSVANPSMAAANLQLFYAGTSQVQLNGGASTAALVYAPDADVTLNGNGTFYGAIVGSTIKTTGGASISYDRSLEDSALTPGNPTFQAFTWSKF